MLIQDSSTMILRGQSCGLTKKVCSILLLLRGILFFFVQMEFSFFEIFCYCLKMSLEKNDPQYPLDQREY